MKVLSLVMTVAAVAGTSAVTSIRPGSSTHSVDTVYVKETVDYDLLSAEVARRLKRQNETTVIDGDLIVKGRIGVGGAPETGTDYGVTIHAPVSAGLRFISNEALKDPQRENSQHRHVGALSLAQDGGLRLDVNSTCFTDSRGCVTEDKTRPRSYSGYDSMGDWAMYFSRVDSAGVPTGPRSQSLVFSLNGDDGHIHIYSFRPGQQIYFNGSTTLNAGDLQWQVPLAPISPGQ